MEKQIIKVTYNINGFSRYIKGKLILETPSFVVVEGLKDGTRFTINKETIQERVDK